MIPTELLWIGLQVVHEGRPLAHNLLKKRLEHLLAAQLSQVFVVYYIHVIILVVELHRITDKVNVSAYVEH